MILVKFNIEDAKIASTPLEANIKITKKMGPNSEAEREEIKDRQYRELIGGLIYFANCSTTRYSVCN